MDPAEFPEEFQDLVRDQIETNVARGMGYARSIAGTGHREIELFVALGSFVVEFGSLEVRIIEALTAWRGLEGAEAASIEAAIREMRDTEVDKELFRLVAAKPDRDKEVFDAARLDMKAVRKRRDNFVHAQWVLWPDTYRPHSKMFATKPGPDGQTGDDHDFVEELKQLRVHAILLGNLVALSGNPREIRPHGLKVAGSSFPRLHVADS